MHHLLSVIISDTNNNKHFSMSSSNWKPAATCDGCVTKYGTVIDKLPDGFFHWGCRPCNGCKSTRDGLDLIKYPNGFFHYDCRPCTGCKKTRKGLDLKEYPDGFFHWDCRACDTCLAEAHAEFAKGRKNGHDSIYCEHYGMDQGRKEEGDMEDEEGEEHPFILSVEI